MKSIRNTDATLPQTLTKWCIWKLNRKRLFYPPHSPLLRPQKRIEWIVLCAFKNLIGIDCFAHGFLGLFSVWLGATFRGNLLNCGQQRKTIHLAAGIFPLAVAANENINPNMSNAFWLRPTTPGRRPSVLECVCVLQCVCAPACVCVCTSCSAFNLDYVPCENSMEMENNKNSTELVQPGESSAPVCASVCVCVLSVWSTWRLQRLSSSETCWRRGSGKGVYAGGFGLALAILIFSIYSWVFCLDLVVAFGVWLQDITVYGWYHRSFQ